MSVKIQAVGGEVSPVALRERTELLRAGFERSYDTMSERSCPSFGNPYDEVGTLGSVSVVPGKVGYTGKIMTTRDAYRDPVIEAYKKDVDRTLLRENLKLTPEQRLIQAMEHLRFGRDLQDAMKRARASARKES